jgi:hypothetical protein
MASGGFRLPTGDWATGTREEDDMRTGLGEFHRTAFLCSVLALAIAAPAIAEDSEDPKERGAPRARGFEQFDTDGDGRLSDEERAAARDKRHKQRLEESDADGDGKISEAERRAANAAHRKRYLGKFDADGDGKLTGEEEEQAKAAREKRRERRGRGPGEQPAVDQPGNAPQEP